MRDAVLIKGNRYGLTIVLDEVQKFSSVKDALYNKLNDAKKFFGNGKVTISFEGRVLSDLEQEELIETIQEASDLEIICVLDEQKRIKPETINPINSKEETSKTVNSINGDNNAIFHKGTLRSGQEIDIDTSIIIMGNVHPGAKVSAKGNVIVIGSLEGYVHAGKDGNESSFIVALKMNPTGLRIGRILGRSSDKKDLIDKVKPKIAFAEDKRIFIEDINRTIYNDLNILNINEKRG